MRRMPIVVCCALLAFAGCSRTSPLELWARAEQARVAGEYLQAIELYGQIVEEHPESEQGEAAAFMIASTYSNDVRDYEKAVAAFAEYVRQYPSGGQAPMALFLKAYLYHNALGNLDSAAAGYRAFMAAYPEHEMVSSAQFELDNLGRPPEDLIPAVPPDRAASAPGKKPL